jgi:hypothetical protein
MLSLGRNLSQLLANTTDIIVANVIEALFVLAFNWLTLAEDHGVGRHNTEVSRINLDDLELDSTHATTH